MRANTYNNVIHRINIRFEHEYLLESLENGHFGGLHKKDLIEFLPQNVMTIAHPKKFLGGGAYVADVFYKGAYIGEKSFFPDINEMDLLFECLEKMVLDNPIAGETGKIIYDTVTSAGFEVRLVVDKSKTISTFMPLDPKFKKVNPKEVIYE